MLATQAERRGVEVLRKRRVAGIERCGDRWKLGLTDGSEFAARFLVDATGRRAAVARRHGARLHAVDRLVAFARFFKMSSDHEPGVLIESFADGWWYTAGLPDGLQVVACMTDIDVARELRLADRERWLCALASTRWIQRVADGELQGRPIVASAGTVYADPVCDRDWIAVGDAASAFDPLSAQGIAKALRSGIFASYAIADRLSKDDHAGLRRYRSFVRSELENYRKTHAQYSAEERRWPDRPFWRRRQAACAAPI